MANSPKQVSRIGFALSSPVRVQILLRLRKHGELSCGKASEGIGPRQPACSHHIAILRREGLVLSRADGGRTNRVVLLSINPDKKAIIEALAA